jgi:hypothetical protein
MHIDPACWHIRLLFPVVADRDDEGPMILGTVDAAPRDAASRDHENRVTPMADTDIDIDTTKLPPDALVTEIERTRAELARTIDQISDRVSPSRVARRTTGRVRERISQVDPLIGGAIALAAVSVTSYLLWRRLRK